MKKQDLLNSLEHAGFIFVLGGLAQLGGYFMGHHGDLGQFTVPTMAALGFVLKTIQSLLTSSK